MKSITSIPENQKILIHSYLLHMYLNSDWSIKKEYSKTPILEYQQMYSKIGVIYEVFNNFGPEQKIYLLIEFSRQKYSKIRVYCSKIVKSLL